MGWAATVMRLWSRKPQVLDPKGSLLTNRMTELVTYGSVGGVGRKPGPYPAPNGGPTTPLGNSVATEGPPSVS